MFHYVVMCLLCMSVIRITSERLGEFLCKLANQFVYIKWLEEVLRKLTYM